MKYLNLKECPIQFDLAILNISCPNLVEVDISGDSWVRAISLAGLAKHEKMKTLHLGHLEHGDTECDKDLEEYPPNGIFIIDLFKNPNNFRLLGRLYLEQKCGLTYWLDLKLKEMRKNLDIRYTMAIDLFKESD